MKTDSCDRYRYRRPRVALTMAILGATTCPVAAEDPAWLVRAPKGIVAAECEHASKAGLEMLEAGGNAVDAAVAASFALAVTRPWHTGLGGGAFLIARFADGRIVVQDARETAPAAATADMFAATDEGRPPASEFGYRAVAVPGLVAGRCQSLTEHGTQALARVLAPAIRLAEEGWAVDPPYVAATSGALRSFEKFPELKPSCGYIWRTHLREGNLREAGEVLKQPELARLLRGLAEGGPDFFYKGPVAETVAAEMARNGGLMTKADLANYEPKSREPLISTYRDFQLILMPPPSSGGVAIAETLNILEALNHGGVAQEQALLALHYQIEAMKHAFADRATWLGDPDFSAIPADRLISKELGRRLAAFVRGDHQREPVRYGASQLKDDAGTSHICVADQFGNVVVTTETINTEFGSLAAIGEWGLILNNEMDDFTTRPGVPNAFGLVQGKPNTIAAGKRPLSSMSPTIVLKDEKPYLLVGAAGGPRIITSVLRVTLSVIDGQLPLEAAMSRTRVHHQWRPNQVYFDESPPPERIASFLLKRGHRLSETRKSSTVQAVLRTEDGWIGASDPKSGGKPAGH